MNDFRLYKGLDSSPYLIHYGKGHDHGGHSGRYPWGSGKNPKQRMKGTQYIATDKRSEYAKSNFRKKYNKKHFDQVIKQGTELSTISSDHDRTKDRDSFYANYRKKDIYKFASWWFNHETTEKIYDKDGNELGTGTFYKWQIKNIAKTDIKVASEDSGVDAFKELYRNNPDFNKFVRDPNRMKAAISYSSMGHPAYREAFKKLNGLINSKSSPTEEEVESVYKLFNYVIPSTGFGNEQLEYDVRKQRVKFFNNLKKKRIRRCFRHE